MAMPILIAAAVIIGIVSFRFIIKLLLFAALALFVAYLYGVPVGSYVTHLVHLGTGS